MPSEPNYRKLHTHIYISTLTPTWQDFPRITEGLDLVEENDQITHLIALDDEINAEMNLDVFKYDPEYTKNEEKYKEIKYVVMAWSVDSYWGSMDFMLKN